MTSEENLWEKTKTKQNASAALISLSSVCIINMEPNSILELTMEQAGSRNHQALVGMDDRLQIVL